MYHEKKIAKFHRQAEKLIAEKERQYMEQFEFDSVISFRTTEELKQAFFEVCNTNLVTPRKYVTGNTLRKFLYCYIQDPVFFENIFNSFESGKHSPAEKKTVLTRVWWHVLNKY